MALSRCRCPTSPAECAQPFCPYLAYVVEILERRWAGVILRAISKGIHRYGELRTTIPDINDRILSERLKDLEADGVIQRLVYPETPVRIEYHLTAKGQALQPVMEAMLHWADAWLYSTNNG
jgi:DNA-binding HxlR family transcriptional regulator